MTILGTSSNALRVDDGLVCNSTPRGLNISRLSFRFPMPCNSVPSGYANVLTTLSADSSVPVSTGSIPSFTGSTLSQNSAVPPDRLVTGSFVSPAMILIICPSCGTRISVWETRSGSSDWWDASASPLRLSDSAAHLSCAMMNCFLNSLLEAVTMVVVSTIGVICVNSVFVLQLVNTVGPKYGIRKKKNRQ